MPDPKPVATEPIVGTALPMSALPLEYQQVAHGQVPVFWLLASMIPVALITTLSWFGIFTFVNGYMIHGLGCTNEQWAATTVWLVGGMTLWQLVLTSISAAIGRRRTVALAMVSVGVGYLGIAFVTVPWHIGALLAIMGISQAATSVVWFPLLADAGGERPGRAMAISTIVNTIVGVVTLSFGGYLISWLDYRSAFLLFGALALACAVLFRFVSRPLQSPSPAPIVALHRLSRADLRKLAIPSFLVVLFLGIGLEAFNYHTLNQLFPNLMRDAHGMGERSISQVVAFGRLPSLPVLFLFALLIDRLSPSRWYGFGMACAGVVIVAMGLARTAAGAAGLYLAFYVFQGIVWSSNSASINAAVEPRLRDAAFAVLSLVANGALVLIGTMHKHLIAAGASLRQVFIICGCAGCLAGLSVMGFSFRRRLRSSAPLIPAPAEPA